MFQTSVYFLRKNCYQAFLFENLLGGSTPPPLPLPPLHKGEGCVHTMTIVFEQPIILSENWKTLTSSNYHTVQYFLMKLCTHFLLTNVDKKEYGIYLFCLDLELYAKIKETWFPHTCFLHFY